MRHKPDVVDIVQSAHIESEESGQGDQTYMFRRLKQEQSEWFGGNGLTGSGRVEGLLLHEILKSALVF